MSARRTADTTNFSLITTMSLASNDMIGSLKMDQVNSIDDLSIMVSSLSEKLNDGIGKLYDGVSQLNQGMNQLNSGLSQLSQNSSALTDGAMQVFQALFDTTEKTFRQNQDRKSVV